MKKTIWIIIIIAIVGVLIYYFAKKPTTVVDDTATPVGQTNDGQGSFDTTQNDQKSLAELLALGTTQQCTFSQNVNGSTNSGTFYLGAGKMRGDFNSVTNGQTMMAHMISDGQDVYTWLDGMNIGFKTAASANQATTPTPGAPAGGNVDINQKLAYNCSPWTTDGTKFVVPTSVQFNTPGMMTPPVTR